MATKLRRLRLNRCDLVDQPANQLARVTLYKRAEKSFLEAEREYFAKLFAPAVPSDILLQALKNTLASSYMLYIAAHSAHWNVEGASFPAWHEFFGELYKDVFDAIDPFAEAIRQHGAYAPTSFAEILSGTAETLSGPMVSRLIGANKAHMAVLTQLRQAADAAGDEGLANFSQERLGVHLKYDWQLRAMEK